MSQAKPSNRKRPIRFLFENSIFLIAGAVGALVWANTDPHSYHQFSHFDFMSIFSDADDQHGHDGHGATSDHADTTEATPAGEQVADAGQPAEDASDEHEAASTVTATEPYAPTRSLTLHFLVNDIFMALFFAIAGKEVLEALLPGGALSDPRKAATPLFATVGGVVGPAVIYVGGVLMFSSWDELGRGWAVPCATDIAFSYLVARIIFGAGHPAIAFLLLLAIADDAIGLVILAVFYPQGELALQWLLLSVGAMALGIVFQKVLKLSSFWWYLLIPGVMSWFAFFKSGIHPSLGLVPVILCMPHAKTDLGIFAREELGRDDALNAFEHWWKNPVELILGLFGLVNAGVAMSNIGTGTWLVLTGLIIGKPVGIVLFTWIGVRFFKLTIPGGMSYRHVLTIGMVAGIGFTVALFVATAAFPAGSTSVEVLDAVKMGALGSFFAAIIAFVGARMMGIRPVGAPAETTVATKSDPSEPPEPSFVESSGNSLA